MARQPRIFRYFCPKCGREQTVQCKFCKATYVFDLVRQPGEKQVRLRLTIGEQLLEKVVIRAKVTPGVNGPQGYIRLAICEALAMPAGRLISS